MRSAIPWLLLLAVACASAPVLGPHALRPSDVTELAALPHGYAASETLRASCIGAPSAGAFDDESLASVDCSFARLSRVLRARAGELSARFIVGKHCRSHGGGRVRLECSAELTRAGASVALSPGAPGIASGPAPSAAQVLDLDEPRPQDGEQVRVAFLPVEPGKPTGLATRAYAAVAETHLPSVGRRELGQVSARCAGCDPSQLRYALRVTAGHVGAGEITAMKCFQDDGDARCVATALVPWSS
jgi:hypothetical protein